MSVTVSHRGGKGIWLNMANANAAAFFGLLGAATGVRLDWVEGEMPVAEARRAVMAARARFDALAPGFCRHEESEYGGRQRDGNLVAISPSLRFRSYGIDTAYLRRKLDLFSELVEAAAAAGQARITWG